MAENDPAPTAKAAAPKATTTSSASSKEVQAPEPLPPEEAGADSEAVKTDNEAYVGVDPIYKQSAYEEPLEPEAGRGTGDEEKEATEAELEVIERVKTNEEGNVVSIEEPVPFEEWVESGASGVATRHLSVRGKDDEQAEKDKEATEEAKDDSGKIPPSSGSVGQPGVHSTGP